MPLYNPASSGAAAIRPAYRSGVWYIAGGEYGIGATNASPVNSTVSRWTPHFFNGPATIQALGTRVAGTASGNVQIGVYADLNGRPGGAALGFSAAIASTTINTSINSAGLSIAIPGAQIVWFGILADNGTVAFNGNSGGLLAGMFGTATQNSLEQGGSLLALSSAQLTYSATPATTWATMTGATFTETPGSITPVIEFQVA